MADAATPLVQDNDSNLREVSISPRLRELDGVIAAFASPPLRPEEAQCLRNLASFVASPVKEPYPVRKLAGVLILLHVNPKGGLSVTLTTRSLQLRSHPGDTALPGGRYDETDLSVEATALREACEEIGLPLTPSSNLFHLTSLPAFCSATLLIVVPVVYFLTVPAPTLLASLIPNPDEVSSIFQLPLKAFLGLEAPPRKSRSKTPVVTEAGSEVLSYSYQDLMWLQDRSYRLHQFNHSSIPSVVSGLTADILILVALIGYYGLTEEESATEDGLSSNRLGYLKAVKNQMTWKELVAHTLLVHSQGLPFNARPQPVPV